VPAAARCEWAVGARRLQRCHCTRSQSGQDIRPRAGGVCAPQRHMAPVGRRVACIWSVPAGGRCGARLPRSTPLAPHKPASRMPDVSRTQPPRGQPAASPTGTPPPRWSRQPAIVPQVPGKASGAPQQQQQQQCNSAAARPLVAAADSNFNNRIGNWSGGGVAATATRGAGARMVSGWRGEGGRAALSCVNATPPLRRWRSGRRGQ